MTATIIQSDDCIDHIPVTDLPRGAVVIQGALVGVACRAIPAGSLGALTIEGTFDCSYVTGTAVAVGDVLYWDAPNQQATTVANGNRLGLCARAASITDTTVRVLLGR